MLALDVPDTGLEFKYLTAKLSKTQVDRLGDRLRQGSLVESDLTLLDEHRRSFGAAYEIVVRTIREQLQLEPTGRPAKSTPSLIEKLRRESIRLTQVQDIAGCRLVVADVSEQERVVASLRALFPRSAVIDRRANPSYGYRAVHIIVHILGKLVEIQVRSSLQHLWAELSEKLSDVFDTRIKYGGGADWVRKGLSTTSKGIRTHEELETNTWVLEREFAAALQADVVAKKKTPATQHIQELRAKLAPILRSARRKLRNAPRVLTDSKKELVEILNNVIDQISKVKP
jgi:ppGpp synthetase/RelA/SpoT-type nucleotidyltranferase